MKYLFAVLYLLISILPARAQNGDVTDDAALLQKYLDQKTFDIDTAARAVVLYEKGHVYLNEGKITFAVERTIKILAKDAVEELAKIDLSYGRNEYVNQIKGVTYNLEQGKVVEQTIERSDIQRDKLDKDITVRKFNLPSVKAGSVIHYSYVSEQPGSIIIPSWDFQSEYPTLYSEYEINLPSYFVYDAIERVNTPMIRVKKNQELDTCASCSIDNSFGTSDIQKWIRRRVPAFKSEPFMSSSDNYVERVKVHLKGIVENGTLVRIYTDWKDFSRKFYYRNNDGCGQPFNNNAFLKDQVDVLVKGKKTDLEKSKAIYCYIRDNFELRNYEDSKKGNDIKVVFNSRSGSVWGINLLLTAMLRKAGIDSAPVLLSTRKNERLKDLYPDPDPINYLASTAVIEKKSYFLDASQPDIPFGILLPKCYNGYCRIVSQEGGEAFLNPDSLMDKSVIMVSLKPQEEHKEKLRLKVVQQFGTLSAISCRKAWRSDTTAARQTLEKRLNTTYNTTFDKFSIKNINNPDERLVLEYEATIGLKDAATLYFDPYLAKLFDSNPFPLTNRQYPVEMDYQQDINYVFNFFLPDGYILDDYPKSVTLKLGNDGVLSLRNFMSYDEAGKTFSLNSRYITRSTAFFPESYNDLHHFYETLIEEQNKKIVLKKIPLK